MPRKKTHDEYEQDLLSKNIAYIPVEPYAGSKNKILHKCPEGHEWPARPNDILSGIGCPSCRRVKQSINQTKTHEQYELELSSKSIPYRPLEAYSGARNKILHKCSLGHEWYSTPNKILSGGGCPECDIINKTKTHEEYLKQLKLKNILYRPLEKYSGSNISIIHQCPLGHKWNALPRGILRGTGMPYLL
jgi:hypothetical protein